MTQRRIDRRAFLAESARAGFTVCGLCVCSQVPGLARAETENGAEGDVAGDAEKEKPLDPKTLTYCGYRCPPDCKFLKATLDNDVELKREAYKLWKLEERFGVPFDPEQAFCYGCKAKDKPQGIILQRCDVRACVRKKGLECCIECQELPQCDRDLWRRFPEFKEQVVAMQQKYAEQE